MSRSNSAFELQFVGWHVCFVGCVLLFLLLGCSQATSPTPIIVLEPTQQPTPTLFSEQLIAQVATAQPDADTPIAPATVAPTLPPTLEPSATPTTIPPTTTPLPNDTGWERLDVGPERRIIQLVSAESNRIIDTLYILRFDPTQFRFDVGYKPGEPQSLENWMVEKDAIVVMNGGYFTPEFYATGLTIVDGVASGASYDFGGMVTITDGGLRVRSLRAEPWNQSERIDAGLQAFPMLIQPGGEIGFTEETGRIARRTVIAQDDAGQVLFIVTARSQFTLVELASYLAQSDLNIDVALNLDGGPSSGVLVADSSGNPLAEGIVALYGLPTVITVNAR